MKGETGTSDKGRCWQAAADYGIDMSQLEYLQTLTPAERLDRHEHARQLVLALRQAGTEHYGYDPRYPPASPST